MYALQAREQVITKSCAKICNQNARGNFY